MNGLLRKSIILMTLVLALTCGVSCGNEDIQNAQKEPVAAEESDREKAAMEIWNKFLPDYKEARRIIDLRLEINTDSWDEDHFFLVTDKYNSIEELKAVLNTVFTTEFIEEKINPKRNLFDGENAFYRENQGQLYMRAAEVIEVIDFRWDNIPDLIDQNDSELIVTFNNIDDGFGKKISIIFTLCRDETGMWKLNGYEETYSK